MQFVIGTARNLLLDYVNDEFVPAAEFIVITAETEYYAEKGDLVKGIKYNTHKLRLLESDVDALVENLLAVKKELASFNVDISAIEENVQETNEEVV